MVQNLFDFEFNACGAYDFPKLRHCNETPTELLPFNFALTAKVKSGWLHFFIDDYQFERLWNNPKKYLNLIKQFDGVVAPDFSIMSDMPKAQQIYNCWRSRVLAALMQKNGVPVVPVIEWSDRKSLEWCLDGLPKNSTLAVQTNGCFTSSKTKANFIAGMEYVSGELNPTAILVYGRGEEFKNYFRNMYFIDSYCQNVKKRL